MFWRRFLLYFEYLLVFVVEKMYIMDLNLPRSPY